MNGTSGIYVHSQTALPKEYANLLKEGSSVFVRILKQSSPNTYIGSFAGGRFLIESKNPLKAGSTFMAKVSFNNGKLNLTQVDSSSDKKLDVSVKNFSGLTGEVSDLLLSLGLPPDGISKTLLQAAIFSGAKINSDKLNKARNAALRFKGKEKEAAEAALILMDKGLELDDKKISAIINFFSEEKDGRKLFNQKEEYKFSEIEKSLKEFFASLTGQTENPEFENKKNDFGFLTVFNHLLSRDFSSDKNKNEESRYSWIVFPFEMEFKKGLETRKGSGVFRVIYDLLEKNAKKVTVNLNLYGKNWFFVVDLNIEGISKIGFSVEPLDKKDDMKNFEKKLKKFFDDDSIKIEYDENIFGFGTGDTVLPVVEGFV